MRLAARSLLVLVALGCGASAPLSGAGRAPRVEPEATLVARPLRGPFDTLCETLGWIAVDEVDQDVGPEPLDCARLHVDEPPPADGGEGVVVRTRPTPVVAPFLDARWVSLTFTNDDLLEFCGVVLRTPAGWFTRGYGICVRTGSGPHSVIGRVQGVPAAFDGEGRVLVHVSGDDGHHMEGYRFWSAVLVCGVGSEGVASCAPVPTRARYDPPLDGYLEEEAEADAGYDWSMYVSLAPADILWVSPHAPPPDGTAAPRAGLYRVRFP